MNKIEIALNRIKSDVVDSFATHSFRVTREEICVDKEYAYFIFYSATYGMEVDTFIHLSPNRMVASIKLVNVSKMKFFPMLEMINLINMDLDYGHLILMNGSQDLLLEAKLFLSDNAANKEMISLMIKSLVNNCYCYLPLVERLLTTSEEPWNIYDKYYDPARLLIQDTL